MPLIHFETKLFEIGPWIIVRLPESASGKLPSRGQVMVRGTINGNQFQTPLEPDGKGSHWFRVDPAMQKLTKTEVGDIVALEIEVVKEWPDPDIPEDLSRALSADNHLQPLWKDITPMARWEWLRWIGSTKDSETRKRRIEVACSKLAAGNRRPCCFNRSMCCVPEVSRNGVLIDPVESP